MRLPSPPVLLAAVLASLAPHAASSDPVAVAPRIRVIEDFHGRDAAPDRLAFRGGLVLSGPAGFGGFSGLLVEGERLVAASDVGRWFTARMVIEDGRLAGLAEGHLQSRLDVHGRPIRRKRSADAEALTPVPGGVLLAVEQTAQLLFYPAGDPWDVPAAVPERVAIDHPLRIAARREGLEALATLPDWSVVAFTEGRRGDVVAAFRWPGSGGFAVPRREDWSITGADALPGGDVVIVERRYGGGIDVGMRVRRLPADSVARDDGIVDGPVLLEADFAAEIDNMEAIAVEVIDGEIVLTVLSDDNLSFLQRTLLLRFAVTDPLPRPKPGREGSGRSRPMDRSPAWSDFSPRRPGRPRGEGRPRRPKHDPLDPDVIQRMKTRPLSCPERSRPPRSMQCALKAREEAALARWPERAVEAGVPVPVDHRDTRRARPDPARGTGSDHMEEWQ